MIDFKKIPVDTLVDTMSLQCGILTLHFQRQTEDGCYFCTSYTSVTSSVTACSEWANSYRIIRISAKNPWLPWFGGECPVPAGCRVEVKRRILGYRYLADYAERLDWSSDDGPDDIIAYRLLESPWQTIEGVWG